MRCHRWSVLGAGKPVHPFHARVRTLTSPANGMLSPKAGFLRSSNRRARAGRWIHDPKVSATSPYEPAVLKCVSSREYAPPGSLPRSATGLHRTRATTDCRGESSATFGDPSVAPPRALFFSMAGAINICNVGAPCNQGHAQQHGRPSAGYVSRTAAAGVDAHIPTTDGYYQPPRWRLTSTAAKRQQRRRNTSDCLKNLTGTEGCPRADRGIKSKRWVPPKRG
jgi:hypothetical protein